MSNSIDYGFLMHRALRRVMAEVLEDIAVEGLPGNHHFFISVDLSHEDIDAPDWLKEQHPNEMTIVIQNWYEDLVVSDDWFEITLSFSNQPVRLHIPFEAVLTFVDPSVEFGLRFDAHEDDDDVPHLVEAVSDEDEEEIEIEVEAEVEAPQKTESEVVSLDSFRK
ncbi:MAG: SspB family protein [Paracoccaceae bacterium]